MTAMNSIKRLLVCISFFIFTSALNAEERVALVIGNSNYQTIGLLKNAGSDALLIADSLGKMGFDVAVHLDLGEDEMGQAIDNFADRTRSADVAAVYFAGHGLQKDGGNFLMPIDAQLKSEAAIAREGISLASLMDILGNVPIGLMFLDACRNNPFAEQLLSQAQSEGRSAGISRGLAVVRPTGDTLVTFATLPNTTAADGEGKNSPFATALARHIQEPNTEVSVLMKRVTRDVMAATGGEQRPQQLSQMQSEFYFARSEGAEVERDDLRSLLTVYPRRVTVDQSVSIVADLPRSCTPFFFNLSPARKLTPIPRQFFKVIEMQNGLFRHEISPVADNRLTVEASDQKGTNRLGYFCEPSEKMAQEDIANTLRAIIVLIEEGEEDGQVAPSGVPVQFQVRSYTIE
ncbi:MAG: hypothetical protein ACI84R_000966 [Candidatus Azotimanducaceae bacterium]|jgi:hypothetical protein